MTVTVYFDLISSMTSNEFMFKPVICSVIFFFFTDYSAVRTGPFIFKQQAK